MAERVGIAFEKLASKGKLGADYPTLAATEKPNAVGFLGGAAKTNYTLLTLVAALSALSGAVLAKSM